MSDSEKLSVNAPVPTEIGNRSEEEEFQEEEEEEENESELTRYDSDAFSEWLARMTLTHPRFLRATSAGHVVAGFGGVLRNRSKEELTRYSWETKSIQQFITHSWHGSPWAKTLSLLIFYNWKASALAGTVAALVAMILFILDLLPGFTKTGRFGGEMYLGPWSLSTGTLVYLLVFFLRHPRQSVFLDKLCINQMDHDEKQRGVLNLGACLKHSETLLILLDDSYPKRLWCLFELAAFLKTHDHTKLIVQPKGLADYFGFAFVLSVSGWSVGMFLPYGNSETTYIFIGLSCVQSWLVSVLLLRYFESVQAIRDQMQRFSFEQSECSCCSANHRDSDGVSIPCDREILRGCVQKWFGSIEAFDQTVQRNVEEGLIRHLGKILFPYHVVIAGGLPLLWFEMDLAASEFYAGDAFSAIGYIIVGIGGVAVVGPNAISSVVTAIRYSPCCCRAGSLLLAVAAGLLQLLAVQSSLQLCVEQVGQLWGQLLWAGAWVMPGLLLWWCATRPGRQVETSRQI